MSKRRLLICLTLMAAISLTACTTAPTQSADRAVKNDSYKCVEGTKIKMIAGTTEVVITLNASYAAADLVSMLPLELTLIERNDFAKGMTLPRNLSTQEATTRSYEIGDFGYWDAGPDLAIFYDDIFEQTIVPIIPLGKADSNAENMRNESGKVILELLENNEQS